MSTPEQAVAGILGVSVEGSRARSGGVYEMRLGDGERVIAKRAVGAGAVRAEAAGLRWLAQAADAVPVPAVRGYDEEWLIVEHVESGRASEATAVLLGRGLASLHSAGASAFGCPPPGGALDAWIGLAPMRNVSGESWARWYAEHRVSPYLRRAVDAGALAHEQAGAITRVCEHIDEVAGPEEAPARLHGDLWSGNVHWGHDGRAWLLDPAAHGGHRETDLAMLQLFGCPHVERVLASYQEVSPLANGWRDRVPLHQLFPLLVHTVLFGGGYAAGAARAARQALALA